MMMGGGMGGHGGGHKAAKVKATKGALKELMQAMGSMSPERARKRKKMKGAEMGGGHEGH